MSGFDAVIEGCLGMWGSLKLWRAEVASGEGAPIRGEV
jgi:hypothetical protein